MHLQLSPLSTLESSFEALNVKKLDGIGPIVSDIDDYESIQVRVSLTLLYNISISIVFQLLLQWILCIIRQLHNLMRVGQRVFS